MVSIRDPAVHRRTGQPVQHQGQVRGLGRRQISTIRRVSKRRLRLISVLHVLRYMVYRRCIVIDHYRNCRTDDVTIPGYGRQTDKTR